MRAANREAVDMQANLGALRHEAELSELNMRLFSIDENEEHTAEHPAQLDAELQELALQANLLDQEDFMDCCVSDTE